MNNINSFMMSAMMVNQEGSCAPAWLTPDEEAAVVNETHMNGIGRFVRLSLRTGLSLPEILGLRWNSFDCQRWPYRLSILEVRSEEPIVLSNAKEQKIYPRILVLPRDLGEELEEYVEITEYVHNISSKIDQSPYMVVDENGAAISREKFELEFSLLLRDAGVRQLPFSALRNTFIQNAFSSGMPVEVVYMILGILPSYGFSKDHASFMEENYVNNVTYDLLWDTYPYVDWTLK